MCGRYTLRDPAEVRAAMEAVGATCEADLLTTRFNVPPTQIMPVVTAEGGRAACQAMRWGIVPFYARKDPRPRELFNARSETAAEKPTFKQSIQRRRCLVPADGFFEWQKQPDGSKTPFFIRLRSEAPFWIAGIYEAASEPFPAGYALLTTGPNDLMGPIHDRMPVILLAEAAKAWLTPGPLSTDEVRGICQSYPAGEMRADQVSRIVNNARNDVPECVHTI